MESEGSGGCEWRQQHGRSWGEAGLLAVVGSVCWGARTLGRGCAWCKRLRISTAGGIQVGGESTQISQSWPAATGCWAGLGWLRVVRHRSILGSAAQGPCTALCLTTRRPPPCHLALPPHSSARPSVPCLDMASAGTEIRW